jgi:hypothetical protein
LFSVGSTDISEQEAADIIARCFPKSQGQELKAANLLKKPQGRKGYLAFAQEVAKEPHRFVASKINKRFTVIAKMVDHLVEPLVHSSGYDFYKDDYARRYANMAAFAFEHLLGKTIADDILAAFNAFARQPSRANIKLVRRRLEEALRDPPHGTEMFLEMMYDGTWRFDGETINSFVDSNDIHLTSVLTCIGYWQVQHSGTFQIVHDESNHFFRRSELWATITNPRNLGDLVVVGEKSLKLPIPVTSNKSAKSHECTSLQLCDLVSGFVSRLSNTDADFRSFAKELMSAGFGEVSLYPVEAGSEFVEDLPSALNGPDAIDRIRRSVFRARSD